MRKVRDEDVGDAKVLAARAAEPADPPGILDLHLLHRNADVDDLGPVLGHARLALLHYEGAGPYPGAVGDPAGERPAAGHAHAAFGPQGLARGSGNSRRRQGGVGKDRARPLRRHVARHQVVRDPDHRAPAGGAVGRGDGLDGRHQLRGRGLAASEIARHAEREDLGRAQLFREVRRQAPGALDLLAPCSDLRHQRRDPFRNPSSVHEPSLRQPGPRPRLPAKSPGG